MFGSKNNFFKQDSQNLNKCRNMLIQLLNLKGRSVLDINNYLIAFDFFILNPEKYDGATIVKDLVDIRNGSYYLDADAMLHDYEYVTGANEGFIVKWRSDIKYIKNMEKNGKGIRVPRFVFLTLIGLVFVPYKKLT